VIEEILLMDLMRSKMIVPALIVEQNTRGPCQSLESFFVHAESNLSKIRNNNFVLIKHGFRLEELKSMPLDEFYDYIQLYNRMAEEKNKSASPDFSEM
jgi:hypothetical protein